MIKIKSILIIVLTPFISGCLTFGSPYIRWLESPHPYIVSNYIEKIDRYNYEWLVLKGQSQRILVFRYHASYVYYLKNHEGIGELHSSSNKEDNFKFISFNDGAPSNLSTIEKFISVWNDPNKEKIIVKLSDQPIAAMYRKSTSSLDELTDVYMDLEKLSKEFPIINEIWIDDGEKGISFDCRANKFITHKTGLEIEQLDNLSIWHRNKELSAIKKALE